MSIKLFTTALLAAGLAVSKPIANRHIVQSLQARQDVPAGVDTCVNQNTGMLAALAALESRAQREEIKVNAENLVIVNIDNNNNDNDRGRGDDRAGDGQDDNRQDRNREEAEAIKKAEQDAASQLLMLQQVNQALLADQQANAAKNEMDNLLRAVAATQNRPDKSTVLLVVQEVKINIEVEVQVDDNKRERRKADASVYKQAAIIANRGKQETETVMLYDPRTLTASDVGAAGSEATPTEAANATRPAEAFATQTVDAVLYNARPTYTAIAEDPAALMRAALEAALEDRQNNDRRAEEVKLNVEIAVEVKIEIEQDNGRGNDRNDDKDRDDKQKQEDRERERQQKEDEQKEDEQDRKEAKKQQKEQEKAKQEQQEREKAEQDAQQKEQEQAQVEAEQQANAEQDKAQDKSAEGKE